MRQIEQDALQCWMAHDDRRQQMSGRSPHVDDRADRGEVVRSRDSWRFGAMESDHRFAEERCRLGTLCEVVEERHAQRLLESALSCFNREGQLAESAEPPIAGDRQDGWPGCAWSACLECLAERSQREPAA